MREVTAMYEHDWIHIVNCIYQFAIDVQTSVNQDTAGLDFQTEWHAKKDT